MHAYNSHKIPITDAPHLILLHPHTQTAIYCMDLVPVRICWRFRLYRSAELKNCWGRNTFITTGKLSHDHCIMLMLLLTSPSTHLHTHQNYCAAERWQSYTGNTLILGSAKGSCTHPSSQHRVQASKYILYIYSTTLGRHFASRSSF